MHLYNLHIFVYFLIVITFVLNLCHMVHSNLSRLNKPYNNFCGGVQRVEAAV